MKYTLILIILHILMFYPLAGYSEGAIYDFEDGTVQGWEADTTVDFLNNLSAPSASTAEANSGTYSLAYPIDFSDQDDNGTPTDASDDFINDVGKVILNPATHLIGYYGYKMYVFIPTSANIVDTNPAYITVALKTGANWNWFETDPVQSAGGNIDKGVWTKIAIDFDNCKNALGMTGQQVTNLGEVHELIVHVSGCGQATGTSTFYVDDVTYEGAWSIADVTVEVEGIVSAIKIIGSIDFGNLNPGDEVVSDTCLTIENIGTVPVTLNLNLINPAGWTAVQTDPGYNTYVLNAMFNDIKPPQENFVELRHALSVTPRKATNVVFAGNQTGVYISPGATRSLWLEFRAPISTEITIQQIIRLVIAVEESTQTVLGISLDTNNYNFGPLTQGSFAESSVPIVVTNTGNITETYWLQLIEPEDWTHSTVSSGSNIYVLNTAFDNDGKIGWNNGTHALSTTLAPCSQMKFTGDYSGASVPAGESRNLWFQIRMPTVITGTNSQNVRVIFVASES